MWVGVSCKMRHTPPRPHAKRVCGQCSSKLKEPLSTLFQQKKKRGGGAVVELLPPHPNPLIPSVSSWVEMPTQEQVRITYILVEADS